jgi:serine/threonine protein kinase
MRIPIAGGAGMKQALSHAKPLHTAGSRERLGRFGACGACGACGARSQTQTGRESVRLCGVQNRSHTGPNSCSARPVPRMGCHSNPHICTVYDIGEDEQGHPFLVMELLEGETLKYRLQRGPILLPELLEWSSQIADALDAATRLT